MTVHRLSAALTLPFVHHPRSSFSSFTLKGPWVPAALAALPRKLTPAILRVGQQMATESRRHLQSLWALVGWGWILAPKHPWFLTPLGAASAGTHEPLVLGHAPSGETDKESYWKMGSWAPPQALQPTLWVALDKLSGLPFPLL